MACWPSWEQSRVSRASHWCRLRSRRHGGRWSSSGTRLVDYRRLSLEPPSVRRHIAPMLIHTEQTPNPATLKFLPGQTVMDAGTRDFADAQSAESSPLAKALFES